MSGLQYFHILGVAVDFGDEVLLKEVILDLLVDEGVVCVRGSGGKSRMGLGVGVGAGSSSGSLISTVDI